MIEIEFAGGLKDAISNLLGFKTAWGMTPDEAICGIDVTITSRDFGTKSIGAGKNDLPNQFLGRPSILDKVLSEVVKQLWIGWLVAHGAEVVYGAD
jgi:hypothetical protein